MRIKLCFNEKSHNPRDLNCDVKRKLFNILRVMLLFYVTFSKQQN